MEKIRVLITDDSKNSREAIETLTEMKITFFEMAIERIAHNNFELPTLLAPEGKFEGIHLVKMYSEAEKNGFHKMIETPRIT